MKRPLSLFLSLLIHGAALALLFCFFSSSKKSSPSTVVPIELSLSPSSPSASKKIKSPISPSFRKRSPSPLRKNVKSSYRHFKTRKRRALRTSKRKGKVLKKLKPKVRFKKKKEGLIKRSVKLARFNCVEDKKKVNGVSPLVSYLKGRKIEPSVKGERGKSEPALSPSNSNKKGVKAVKSLPSFNPLDYKRLVLEVLRKKKFYPPLARRLGVEGVVRLEVVFDRSGKVLKVKVLNSPPFVLKRAAVKLVKSCKFPPLPKTFKGKELRLEIEISYKLLD
ncbi:energy transducer TonB [Thermovibrio sp.]